MSDDTKQEKFYRESTTTDWEELKQSFSTDFDFGNYLFRGQSNSAWGLETRPDRLEARNKTGAEQYLINEFQRRIHHYLPESHHPATLLEQLALMQHHGTATRLLDWSYSPYVATFFAIESVAPGESCAVWALDASWCEAEASDKIEETPGLRSWQLLFDDDRHFRRIFMRNQSIKFVAPVQPDRMNERLTVQKGAFLCPGSVDVPFEENLRAMRGRNGSSELVTKIVIPATMRAEILTDFQRMNVGADTLFPGLDGFARSLNHVVCSTGLPEFFHQQSIRRKIRDANAKSKGPNGGDPKTVE